MWLPEDLEDTPLHIIPLKMIFLVEIHQTGRKRNQNKC